jgi:hypothetical protein
VTVRRIDLVWIGLALSAVPLGIVLIRFRDRFARESWISKFGSVVDEEQVRAGSYFFLLAGVGLIAVGLVAMTALVIAVVFHPDLS